MVFAPQITGIMVAFHGLFIFASAAEAQFVEGSRHRLTKSEGTISREAVVTVQHIRGPASPRVETKLLVETKPTVDTKPLVEKKPAVKTKPKGQWSVQVRSFPDETDSLNLGKKLQEKGYDARVVAAQVRGQTWYRVRVGQSASKEEAQALLKTLKSKEGFSDAFLVTP